MKELIAAADYKGIQDLLSQHPALANEEIPFDEKNTATAHPLHRICDGVFANKYTDEQAVEMARLFLDAGARIEGNDPKEKKDTPLVAAASLHADQVALLYIDNKANIHHPGCHGGTALHWAAWCGRDVVVQKLVSENAAINRLCFDFKSTPLFWAVHGLRFGGEGNRHHQVECARLLLAAGADKTIPNFEGYTVHDLLTEQDSELKVLLQ